MLHLRVVPGFWIAVEEIRRPELRSQPVILGGLPHQRGVVRESSFAAQQRGVQPGMPLSQAHQHCPEGFFLMPDLPAYEAVWGTICDILRTYTPLVEPLQMGQAVLDLSGCERLWGDGLETARAISSHIRRSTGIVPWLGMASNRLVAQLASTAVGAEGISVIERGQEAAFLADLSLTLLPGMDPRLALTFQVLGLRTIGQLAALPAASVRQRFGVAGERLHSYARGIDPRPVVPPPQKPSVTARRECEDGSIEEALEALHRLADTCAAELQQRALAGTVVELVLEPEPSLDSPA
jgi:DNA polymerase-4